MTGTGRRITTEEVTLKTASVEIRTLTINGKQMTLAVFRQLINDGSVIDDEVLELRGDPWGIVNYCTTKECATSFGHHLHVIWQDGGELRRSQEYPLSSEIKPVGYRRRRYDELNDLAQKWATAATIEDWTPSRWEKLKPCIPFSQNQCRVRTPGDFPLEDRAHLKLVFGGYAAIVHVSRELLYGWGHAVKREILASSATDDDGNLLSKDQWRARIDDLVDELRDYERRYSKLYGQLASLEQLFIAV